MRNLSTEFKEEQNNGNHRYLKFVDITLKNGTELHLDNSNLWSNGFTFEEAVSSGDNFDIGAAIINKFSIVINNIEEKFSEYVFSGAKAVVYVGLKLSTGIEKIRICTGTVSEEPRQKSSIITLTFLDNMSKFDRDYADVKTVFPATRNQVVRDICSICGVTLQTVKFDRDDFVIQSRPENEALTCRQMLAWVAQIGCQWAKCDEYGRLCIGWYENLSLETNNIINIKSITNMSVDLDDIVITGVKVTEHKENPSEDNLAKTYMYGKEGYVLSIAGNKLITENTGNTIASIIGEKCVGMKFRQFSLNCITDISIEAGDTVKVTDRKGNTFLSYATNVNLQPGNYESISCGAESPERNSAKQYSLLTQVEVAARKNIQKEKTEREKALEELAGRLENSSGVFTTVETDTGGGKIYYLHNKPKLSESDMVWKMTAEAWAVSTDGGKTWNAGMTVDGDTIVRILTAMGINADWINTGAITVRDSNQNIIFSVDMDTKRVIISGDSVQIGGRPVQDVINSGISESKNYSDKKLSDYANTISKDLENLQTQVDGQVEDWYFDYEPSMQNIPASQWTTTEERQKHIGDRFFWKSKGYAYRFMEDNGVWGWILLQDTDITKAMQTAQNAKDVADGKRRTFVSTPKPPYDIGDLWTNGEDILTCTVARASGSLYVSTDWKKLNEYTDDTVANQALEEAKKAHNILIQLDNEYQGIPADYKGNISVFPEVKTQVYVFFGHQDVSAQCTYTIQKSASVSGTWDNTRRVYTVTGLSADTGWVDITASYLGVLYATKRFVVSKIKGGIPGPTGPQGNPGPVSRNYILESSDTVVKKGADNRLSPATITFKAFYRDGNAASRTVYAGRMKIEESTNGTSFATKYTSAANESVKSYTPSSAEVRIIRCTLYAAGGVTNALDTQTVVVLTDVSNLEIGGRNLYPDSKGDFVLPPRNTGGEGDKYNYYKFDVDMRVGETYTIGADTEITHGSFKQLTIYPYPGGTPTAVDIPPSKRVVHTFTKKTEVTESILIYAGLAGETRGNGMVIRKVKIETGNKATDWSPAFEDMETLVITLSNEAHTITTDKNGNGGNFTDCETTVQVYNGTQDVTAQTTYTVTKSSGITGSWDNANHKYKVTALSTDDGYVDIKAVYNGISVIKRFTVSKSKTGATGATGADGKTSYFHIKYAPVQNPTASQMTETPNVFIGTYVDFTETDSPDPKKYTWYRFQGLQGPGGTQGIPGKNGANGQTSYLHIKYSNDGGKTFTANTGETPGDYIGQYVDFTQADSTDPKRYSWSKTKGETGRTYFIELSANILKRKQNNRILPISVSAKAFYRDGTSATRTAYAGRWKIETSTNGVDYTTVASSTVDESSKSYRVETLAANIVSVRFALYAAGGFTTPLDMQSIPIVIDVDSLTHEQIFNLLTNNGAMKGIYQSGGQLYINGTYIRSLILTADMIQGKELASLGATLGGFIVESKRIRNTSSDGKKAMYMGSYDWNNSDFLVVQNNASGSWKNLLMLKYDGSLESRDSAQTALAQLNAGGLKFRSKDGNSWADDMVFNKNGMEGKRNKYCKVSVKADNADTLTSGAAAGWERNVLGDTRVYGELEVKTLKTTGTKKIVKQTPNYGEASFYCDETPTPLLSDYGEGTIASDGLCYVDIDDIFREAVNSNIQYFVFLQKEGPGDCWVKEREATHFVVQGTPDLRFTWGIKVKQKGTEHLRFSGEEQNLRIHSLEPETVMEAEQEEATQQENEAMEQYTNWMFQTIKEMEERYNEEIDIIYES